MTKSRFLARLLMCTVLCGCSLIEDPGQRADRGVVVLHFVGRSGETSLSSGSPYAQRLALPVADSVRVCVFPAGATSDPEVCKGAFLSPPVDSVTLVLEVIAEDNKRVAVELYEGGKMAFFGVDEDVDVSPGVNTTVRITARSFEVASFWPDPPVVEDGKLFTLRWFSVLGAPSYRIQRSSVSDFSDITWETIVADTFWQGSVPSGDYFLRVAAENAYAVGEFTPLTVQPLHVYGPPTITSVVAREMLRTQIDTIDVYGDHLDYPGTQAVVFGRPTPILASSPDCLVLEVDVPQRAFSSRVAVATSLGAAISADYVPVQTIAYIMGPLDTGDVLTAIDFESAIEGFGQSIDHSAVKIVPYTMVNLLDLSLFDLILVGLDTGTSGSDWGGGKTSTSDAVAQSGAMILGVGTGGAAYFERIGLDIGIGKSQVAFQSQMYVVDGADDIFNIPNGIPIPPDKRVELYGSAVRVLSVGFSSNFQPYATLQPFVQSYPLAEETSSSGPGVTSNLLWGFEGSPSRLSANGLATLENVVVHLISTKNADIIPVD